MPFLCLPHIFVGTKTKSPKVKNASLPVDEYVDTGRPATALDPLLVLCDDAAISTPLTPPPNCGEFLDARLDSWKFDVPWELRSALVVEPPYTSFQKLRGHKRDIPNGTTSTLDYQEDELILHDAEADNGHEALVSLNASESATKAPVVYPIGPAGSRFVEHLESVIHEDEILEFLRTEAGQVSALKDARRRISRIRRIRNWLSKHLLCKPPTSPFTQIDDGAEPQDLSYHIPVSIKETTLPTTPPVSMASPHVTSLALSRTDLAYTEDPLNICDVDVSQSCGDLVPSVHSIPSVGQMPMESSPLPSLHFNLPWIPSSWLLHSYAIPSFPSIPSMHNIDISTVRISASPLSCLFQEVQSLLDEIKTLSHTPSRLLPRPRRLLPPIPSSKREQETFHAPITNQPTPTHLSSGRRTTAIVPSTRVTLPRTPAKSNTLPRPSSSLEIQVPPAAPSLKSIAVFSDNAALGDPSAAIPLKPSDTGSLSPSGSLDGCNSSTPASPCLPRLKGKTNARENTPPSTVGQGHVSQLSDTSISPRQSSVCLC
ncbi:hypothetical protein BDN72DRAFT_836688 [Pluteus cervinus]|uniref:Uncharacterized protein n=1 Tax=Pluteus cervinus TaxID=181527 RepID=A0ACD3B239_9AGAR|nr:hypothetical protein BDN72DRAFT_836688 [Pluteus cervinus]